MKLNKILLSIATATIVATPITCLTSCNLNNKEEDVGEEHAQYIYNRTFSLMAAGSKYVCFGTGWIIDDATKSNTDDYSYWIATNWHVIHGNDNVGATKFYYADKSLKDSMLPFIDQASYKQFGSGCFTVEDKSNFLYSNQEQSTYLKSGIDFYVVKADFGSPTGQIKTKLDNLNKFRKENDYITKFVKDSSAIRNKTKYIGGYPMKTSGDFSGGQWESHTIQGSSLDYCDLNTEYYQSEASGQMQKGHAIGDPNKDQQGKTIEGTEGFYYYDISPNYVSTKNVGTNWMTGGASGSMLLTEDYEVCGIYWGGWSSDTEFYPSFSLFYNDAGDFVSKYTK